MHPKGEEYYNPDISLNYEDLLNDVLIPYAEEIYERYTVLPDNFPKRVSDLAHDITQNSETDYDKADDIRLFLRGRYPYTLTPGDTPEDRDFVDYFLFDLQKGYCTSFASAFVTMCRSVGLPARYVEGYVTPRQQNGDNVYTVTHKEGHAWGEVYFEGYGWVRFESTPSATSEGRPTMLPSAEQYPLEQAEMALDLILDPDSELISNSDDSLENSDINVPGAEISGEAGDDIAAYESEAEINAMAESEHNSVMAKRIAVRNIIFAVLIFASAVFIFITLRVLSRRRFERSIEKKSNSEAVITYFYILMKYMKFFNLEKGEHETIAQYSERMEQIKQTEDIENIADSEALYNIKNAAEIFSKAYYGGGNIVDGERDTMAQAVKDIDAAARSLLGSSRYAYYKYIAREI